MACPKNKRGLGRQAGLSGRARPALSNHSVCVTASTRASARAEGGTRRRWRTGGSTTENSAPGTLTTRAGNA